MDYLADVDAAVKEYLVFRGFLETLRAMEREEDRLEGLSSERVALRLLEFATGGQLAALLGLWRFLENRCGFGKLQPELAECAEKLKNNLFKLYLVNAKRKEKLDSVTDFFAKNVIEQERLDPGEWRAWYSLPYCQNPEKDVYFGTFFQDEWTRLFSYSLSNFIGQVFRLQSAPQLLAFPLGRQVQETLSADLKSKDLEICKLKEEAERLRVMLANREYVSTTLSNMAAANSTNNENLDLASDQSSPPQPPQNTVLVEPVAQPKFTRSFQSIATGKHSAKVNRCKFAPDGRTLATCSSDSTVRFWSWTPESLAGSDPRPLHQDQILFCPSPALSIDWISESSSDVLAIGTSSSLVKLWDANKRTEKGELVVTDGAFCLPFVIDTKFCARKQLLATVSAGQSNLPLRPSIDLAQTLYTPTVTGQSMLCLWNVTTLQLDKCFDSESFQMNSIAFNHNGSLLVAGSVDGRVQVLDVQKGSPIMQWSVSENQTPVNRISLSSDETAVICLLEDGSVSVWSLHRIRERVFNYPPPAPQYTESQWSPSPNDFLAYGDIVLSPDNPKGFLTASPNLRNSLEYFDTTLETRALLGTTHNSFVTCLDWAPSAQSDYSIASTGCFDGSVKLYRVGKSFVDT